jgi:hypothetical protein
MGKPPLWSFAGYVTEAGKRIVQNWYDSLPHEEREELQDLLNYASDIELWKRPEFDKVSKPLHEFRVKANIANHEVRLYGVFDPNVRRRFIFLHGVTAKKRDRDKKGQDLALSRWSLIKQGKASTHEFAIESGFAAPNQT